MTLDTIIEVARLIGFWGLIAITSLLLFRQMLTGELKGDDWDG